MASPISGRFPVTKSQIVPTLSCEFCRQRKIKCDKLNPCTNCQQSGVDCEPVRRRRLPRGRHNTRKPAAITPNLQDKIDRLEALINIALQKPPSTFTNDNGLTPNSISTEASVSKGITSNPSPLDNGPSTDDKLATPRLWSSMLKEIRELQGLASTTAGEAEGDDDDDEFEDQESPPAFLAQNHAHSRFVGLSLGQFGGVPLHSLSLRPAPAVATALCNIYLDQVDRIFKVLHRTSVQQHFNEGKPYSAHRSSRVAEEALDAAIFYAAIASMTDRQCQLLFDCSKATVLSEYQKACEISLERADLMRTNDMTVLQAFVLYLIATRAHDKSRAVWTLLATAVRIAQALDLHVESIHPFETFFSKQMRKRLWLTICFLDMQTCIDPDSKPLIPFEMTQITLPLNVNDSDFDVRYQGLNLSERHEVTDMTFARVTYRLLALGRSIYCTSSDGEHDKVRQELVASFDEDVLRLTRKCNPEDNNYSWFIYHATNSLRASAKFFIMKPLIAMRKNTPQSLLEHSSILELCEKMLENTPRIHNDERGEGFRWYITPQWPALLLTIRECSVTTDISLIQRVWPLVEDVFECYQKAHALPTRRTRIKALKRLVEATRKRVQILIQPSPSENQGSTTTSEDAGIYGDVESFANSSIPYHEGQPATGLIDPSWIAWDDFINELSSEQLPNDGLGNWEDSLFITPDMIFPFT
ncbi:fungal-specific transcription factor domain-containing protein [Talaromyces proteolyticus]|uniref:Fungal-specific transcription factor domain-containing protein n=1 Tax=Talaromyces proteolyticus TaxID=1131652 RepID=A0AAD4PSU2_9EURO|nr:fungal-specific transcription factor domain-containing protein [Talaromyces proteolyticus]KAH8692051.1 fungal-specific transcription factor domain-containing protein [Talaromyces proteolyticus]